MAKQRRITAEERIAEYVDSPLMSQRVRCGKQLSARIAGNYGLYRTEVSVLSKGKEDCTCPAETRPCKHIHALRATWEANPESFFDLDAWLSHLPRRSKQSLVETIGEMIMHSPELLGLFGVPGFTDSEDNEWQEW